MPEHISGTNIWNLLVDEHFIANDGRDVKGPITGIRVEEFPQIKTLSVQGIEEHYEVPGIVAEDFENAVKKIGSK